MKIAILGASGFVGSAVVATLEPDHEVIRVRTPRLRSAERSVADIVAKAAALPELDALVAEMRGVDVVVNAAGNPDASSLDEDVLFGANALLPALALRAAEQAGARRFVHVSSAVVQNDKPVLDASEDLRPFSPYSASKVLGEEAVRAYSGALEVTRYRPPSVHAPSRRVTRMIRRISTSPVATVAAPGGQHTPQALLENVAAAIAALATWQDSTPSVVHHPSEGVTCRSLMEDLSGGRRPVALPRWVARLFVRAAKGVGRIHKPTAANARRVELLWLGQEQAPSWLTEQGWTVPVGREGWRSLAAEENA